ncbi:hypothetical protein EMIHUDRAFT_240750 [Emiliania huxleyi CCMP1516]|uniref:Uncharacterized protein n=2 Tax=Emiliania huxleyi TaxID=2903 RepID=A0A0D3IQJ3_EMIH1|nr:hypothetical protein EMIHUDRAFT_212630 [Emiliania huxleyi CCMP1516]XP_005774341.1 hypothetical protein EMIHUDRAFT_240750 [Emiliania huxleyi CCMP1516]EOD13528.1 hypothetical protein EMIHUDRAFT_212630 [Emiliania huxleyi CCMP1516]EOD21912.1 hypothetical protein EMIHUDRAFT_240750 [Emiliania huxleyi CCMP1516]|eukprot:XP_005765957.1 hypothetical protein EMIHUDRAFT_212630 [Emiliania huxleyi CCMP1516]
MSASDTPEWARRLAQRERDQEASLRANSSAAAEADEVENAAGVLPWGGLRAALPPAVPSLTALALSTLAAHPELITDLSLTGRLDFRLACVFREAGHESLREAIEALDLVSAIPTHNTITRFKTL